MFWIIFWFSIHRFVLIIQHSKIFDRADVIIFYVGYPPLYVIFSVRLFVCPLRTIFQEPWIMWSLCLVHMCKMIISPGVFLFFFSFFLILIFSVVRGVKGQKMAQNKKWELHPSCIVSQEQCSIWSWFLLHLCKIMMSPCVFFIFLNFNFSSC